MKRKRKWKEKVIKIKIIENRKNQRKSRGSQ
jgi:hypothetical protein